MTVMNIPMSTVDGIQRAHLPEAEDSYDRIVGHRGIHVLLADMSVP
jgi:hypothetical protein